MAGNPQRELSFQERLKTDRDGSFRREVVDQFGDIGAEIKRHENEGLPADEFKSLNGLKAALEEAKEVVNKAWEMYHSGI